MISFVWRCRSTFSSIYVFTNINLTRTSPFSLCVKAPDSLATGQSIYIRPSIYLSIYLSIYIYIYLSSMDYHLYLVCVRGPHWLRGNVSIHVYIYIYLAWIITCILFVFGALTGYAAILFKKNRLTKNDHQNNRYNRF